MLLQDFDFQIVPVVVFDAVSWARQVVISQSYIPECSWAFAQKNINKEKTEKNIFFYFYLFLISAALYFNVFYKYLSNKKLLRILPCQKFHLS